MYHSESIEPNRTIKAILFDLDGTLMETAHDLAAALNQLLMEENKQPLTLSDIAKEASNGTNALLALGFSVHSNDESFQRLKTRFLDIYLHLLQTQCTTPLFPEIERLLQKLEKKCMPWGIVTNKPKYLTTPLLAWHKLHQRCAVLICPEDVIAVKPAPEALFKACQAIQCPPNQCLYIGDHERDIIAGHHAKMTTIAAAYGYLEHGAKPEKWKATHIARHPSEILQWLEKNQWRIPSNL